MASKSKPIASKNTKKQTTLSYNTHLTTTQKIVAIGSSTGGTEAIKKNTN